MQIVLQRVKEASVTVDEKVCGKCGLGYLLLVGIEAGDDETDARLLCEKIAVLRVFEDENQKMNRSICDVGGSVLAISNFTLLADYRRGTRPDYMRAEKPQASKALYETFCAMMQEKVPTEMGVFGADMQIDVKCDGPVTLTLDSRVLKKERTLT